MSDNDTSLPPIQAEPDPSGQREALANLRFLITERMKAAGIPVTGGGQWMVAPYSADIEVRWGDLCVDISIAARLPRP